MSESRKIIVEPTREAAAAKAAELIRDIIRRCITQNDRCSVALAGGNTPKAVYELLAKSADAVAWPKLQIFFSDERDVPRDGPDSNYRMARRSLLNNVPIPVEHIHPMPADAGDIEQAAQRYERKIRDIVAADSSDVPRLDLITLGMGSDGHTASLFPGLDVLDEKKKLIAGYYVPKLGRYRMTFTFPLINAAANILLLVTGDDKAETIQKFLQNSDSNLPIAKVNPSKGEFYVVLDKEASKLFCR